MLCLIILKRLASYLKNNDIHYSVTGDWSMSCLPWLLNIFSKWILSGLSISFKGTSTLLFTDGTFLLKFEQFHEYLIQHCLKSGGTKDHFRWVKVPGTTPFWKAWLCKLSY